MLIEADIPSWIGYMHPKLNRTETESFNTSTALILCSCSFTACFHHNNSCADGGLLLRICIWESHTDTEYRRREGELSNHNLGIQFLVL